MIKQNFKYTQDNYGDAYKEAARTGKPVVAIFGSFENNNSRQLIENSLPEAKGGAGKDAVYVYIDRAKCKDGAMASFADGQLAGGHNAPVSLVFSVKPGQDGSIQPEESNFRWQGADRSMIGSFNQAITQAQEKMQSYKGQFEQSAALNDKTEKIENPSRKFEGTREVITQAIIKATETKDWHQSERHYHAAIDAADKITPQDIQAERQRISQALSTTPQGSEKFQQLMQDASTLRFVENAKTFTRADLGIACMKWANEQTGDLKHKFRDVGSQWIKAAGDRNQSIYSNEGLIKRVSATGIPEAELKELLPQLAPRIADQRDLYRFGGDGKKSEVVPKSDGNPEQRTEPSPNTRETKETQEPKNTPKVQESTEAKKTNDNKETKEQEKQRIIKEDEDKAVKSEEEYNAALREAADKGLPVIVKIGSTSCGPCKKMAPSLKQAEEELKGKAVVIRVLYENTEELASKLGADSGVPITIVAGVSQRNGQTALVPFKTKQGFNDKPDELRSFLNEGLPLFDQWKKQSLALKR
jgi:thiol-disulfide isomerase/thioredoxin